MQLLDLQFRYDENCTKIRVMLTGQKAELNQRYSSSKGKESKTHTQRKPPLQHLRTAETMNEARETNGQACMPWKKGSR